MNWKNETIKFTRKNLMEGFDSDPMYAYDAKGDFRHGYTKLRIVKASDNMWELKALRDGVKFETYNYGFMTKREAVEYATDRLS